METQEALKVEKLYTEVVEDKLILAGQEPIKIWLRPLKYPVENARSQMAHKETYDLMIESGSGEDDANQGGYCAFRLQALFYSIRKNEKADSPRLFENVRQAGAMSAQEQERLLSVYQDAFFMTEEDLGNSLRVKTNS
jgi:hypothetical protein